MINQVPIMPIYGNFGYFTRPIPFGFSCFPNPYFGDFNCFNNRFGLFEQNMQYNINNLLYSSSGYTNWNNIPLFDVPNFDFNLYNRQNNYLDYSKFFDINKNDEIINEKFKVNSSLIQAGYDITKGLKLAKIAKKNATGFIGYCARVAKSDIQEANLGKYEYGHATDCDRILDKNPNFKRVDISLNELKKTPGIVLVYKKGVAGYSEKHGHIEITGGDGNAYSDGVTRHIRPGYIAFAPVMTSKSYTA